MAIVVVTIVNCAAIAVGGRIAMVLTGLKITLVCGVGIAAAALAQGSWTHFALSASGSACDGVAAAARGGFAGFGAAMLGAMWAYNGWNEITYVSEEVKDPQRNLPLAIIGGLGIIAFLYISVNVIYFYVLTPAEVAGVPAASSVATEVVARSLGAGCLEHHGRRDGHVDLRIADDLVACLRADPVRDGAGRPVHRRAGPSQRQDTRAGPCLDGAGGVGDRPRAVGLLRHASPTTRFSPS